MKTLLVLILALTSIPSFAFDVISSSTPNRFVKVTLDGSKKFVKFDDCSTESDRCMPIGKKGYYRILDLMALRDSEKWDIGGAVLADLALVAAGGYVGTYAGFAAGTIAGSTTATPIAIGNIAGLSAGVALSSLVDRVNPYEQYKQLETLESRVLKDQQVQIDYSTKTFVKRLAAVLDNL